MPRRQEGYKSLVYGTVPVCLNRLSSMLEFGIGRLLSRGLNLHAAKIDRAEGVGAGL